MNRTINIIQFGKGKRYSFLSVLFIFLFICSYGSPLSLSGFFCDNMIVQAGHPFLTKGKTTAFIIIIIQIENRIKNVQVDKNGNWPLFFSAFEPGDYSEIGITCGMQRKGIRNVIAGEIWLCSGQSNVQLLVKADDEKDSITNKNPIQIRYFIEENNASSTPFDEVKRKWIICDSNNIEQCSALGLSFAFNLNKTLKVPVGLIINAIRGTLIELWAKLNIIKEKEYNLVSTGPVFEKMKVEENEIRLTFNGRGSSLKYLNEKPIKNLEIAGVGFQFLPATARIDGNSLLVWNEKILHPESVGYAWKNVPPELNLANQENMPAAPFLTGQMKRHIIKEKENERLNLNFQKNTQVFNRVDIPYFSYHELSYKEISEFTTGVINIEKSDAGFVFANCPEQIIKVISFSPFYKIGATSISGVNISFLTSSDIHFLAGSVIHNSSEKNPFHVLCNGKLLGILPEQGDTSLSFSLNYDLTSRKKMKEIQIVFPAFFKGIIKRIGIQKGALLKKKISKCVILAHGNSITKMGGEYQDFLSVTANNLGYSLYDAGIGCHVFQEEYLTQRLVKNPAIILHECGTNDWAEGRNAANAKPFLEKLRSMYPGVPVAIIDPLYRFNPVNTDAADPRRNKVNQIPDDYRNDLRMIANGFEQVTVFDHKTLLPKYQDLYKDGIHPNAKGQRILGANLTEQIKKIFSYKE